MFSEKNKPQYPSYFLDIYHYVGEGYAAYMLASLNMANSGSLDTLFTFLSLWGAADGVFQLVNVLESLQNKKILLSRTTNTIAQVLQLLLTGELFFFPLLAQLLQAKEKHIAPDFNSLFLIAYTMFAVKAGIDLITSIIELIDLKIGEMIEHIGSDDPHADSREEYVSTLKEHIHIKIAKVLSSACELAGWTALACGYPQGWIGLAAAVTIKAAQMGYTRVSIHGIFGEKSAKRENTEFLAQPSGVHAHGY